MTVQNFYSRDTREIALKGPHKDLPPIMCEMENMRDAIETGFQNAWNVSGPGGTGGLILALPEEYGFNPVLNPPTDRAYYPTLLYFPAGFDVGGTLYKYLCIHAGDVDAGGGLLLDGSQDFKTWVQLNGGNPLVGLPASAHHPFVLQTGPSAFRLYYWNSSTLYTVAAIRTAVSTDLINWTSDQPLQNGATPIVTGVFPNWNRGSYGVGHAFYNPTASNTGTNPFDYSYVIYFDGTTGAFESYGLGYSADGVTFELWGLVLDHGSTVFGNAIPWDASYATFGQIFQTPLGKWMMFYSGGKSASHEGVGVAVSDDRLHWTKLSVYSPLLAPVAGTWRDNRCYAVGILTDFTNRFSGAGDEADMKMLVSGRSASGDYTCGYFNVPYMYADVREALYRLGKL